MTKTAYLKTLTDLCNLPTAPYLEEHVIAYLLAWAQTGGRQNKIQVTRDPAGNVYLTYHEGKTTDADGKTLPPLVIEAHMDHPGFVLVGRSDKGQLVAYFRGGVRPSHFKGSTAAFWVGDQDAMRAGPMTSTTKILPQVKPKGHWVQAKVLETRPGTEGGRNHIEVILEAPSEEILPGSLGMWALPDAAPVANGSVDGLFAARVCDDIAGLASALCVLDELVEQKVPGHVIVMASRAEEVGFAGVLAAVHNAWVPKDARVIGIETSKASAGGARQGAGPIVRVGDLAGIFSAGLTHFICQAGGFISDEDKGFAFQRKLMDGGTCNSTAFTAFGYDAAGVCLALGNYHNMTKTGEVGFGDGGKTGEGIGSETIHLGDFHYLVRLLVEVVKRYPTYQPNFGAMRERLEKLHATEQSELLYGSSDQPQHATMPVDLVQG